MYLHVRIGGVYIYVVILRDATIYDFSKLEHSQKKGRAPLKTVERSLSSYCVVGI
jgi:hypothetical protein